MKNNFENKQFLARHIRDRIKQIIVTCKAPNNMVRNYEMENDFDFIYLDTDRELDLIPGSWIKKEAFDQNPPKEFYMEIFWKNDRVTKIPLGNDIVDVKGGQNQAIITITLQSNANDWEDMDNRITIVNSMNSLNDK